VSASGIYACGARCDFSRRLSFHQLAIGSVQDVTASIESTR
jgi:hypothetical protein